ncbi:MAG: acetate--CoA ligase family protein [Thermoplasmata archaeon]
MNFIFTPKTVAIVGASSKEGKIGYEIMKSLMESKAKLYPVNPNEDEIMGLKCYKNISSIPEKIDLMVISLTANQIPQVLEEGAKEGVKGAVIISGGFGEVSEEGAILEKKIKDVSHEFGIRIVGPNCIGVFSSLDGFDTFFQAREAMKRPGAGPVSFMTQSGTYGVTLLELMEENSVGVSKFISFGNKVDINEVDMLEYFKNDKNTKIISAYLESFSDGRKFYTLAKNVSKIKPIVVLKAGRTPEGQSAAKSHTGALAENHIIFEGSMKQSGVIVVDDIEDMVDAIKIIVHQPLPNNGNVLLLTNGAGPCVVTADAIGLSKNLKMANLTDEQKLGLKKILPEYSIISNPLDLTGSATPKWYENALKVLKDSKNIDIFVLYFVIPNAPIYRNINELFELFKKNWNKPIICVMAGGQYTNEISKKLEKMHIPVLPTARRLVNALDKIVEYSRWKNNHNKDG